ncbi:MAG TPA: helix-turn-helix transcriptional regulator [Pyrinomonadaceae bacterium]|nr:helix-turn-helix transcriptional regulator [Pyrinomonadaceae bacterium]
MALLALSHTPVEHRLYQAMLTKTSAAHTRVGSFSIRQLMLLSRMQSYSTVRRARAGLLNKLSIECHEVAGGNGSQQAMVYLIFTPDEIFARRRAASLEPFPTDLKALSNGKPFVLALERMLEQHDLSRREAQVALWCAQGLTNTEIGGKLFISEQTVKFHLRHIFIKCGVRRRTELISRLLSQEDLR